MANVTLGFPNLIDDSALSGGAWATTLPRANLQNRTLGKKARSSNALAASTKLDIDLGTLKKVRVFALIAHNLTMDATYRLRASSASDFSTVEYDSGTLDVWSAVYSSASLNWEDPNWWSGKYTAEQVAGVNWSLVVPLQANVFARYWRLELFDTANPSGFVEAGRLFIGPVWQPIRNMIAGASLQWETATTTQQALSGAEVMVRRQPARVVRFTLNSLSTDEAFENAYEIQRRAGIDAELLYIFDPDDTVHAVRRQFLGRLRQLSAIEHPYTDMHKVAFEIKELL